MAVKYSGSAMLGVSVAGAGAMVDLGGGKCTLLQRVQDADQRVDETLLVHEKIPDWRGEALHSYTLEWTPTGRRRELPCRLLIVGQLIKEFRGHDRPMSFDSTLEISFERGTGTGLLDVVEWNINGGRPKNTKGTKRSEGPQRIPSTPNPSVASA